MTLIALLGMLGILGGASAAWAYPNMVRHGYSSCVTCHYNPFGNGPLTDYGRALSAQVVAAKPFWNSSATDESLGAQSGFLGGGSLPDFLRLSADFRGMYYVPNMNQEPQPRFIVMQGEGSVILRQKRDKYFAVLTGGYAPVPASKPAAQADDVPTIISREHYVAVRPSKGWGLYAGMMDTVFGIRTPDHVAYSRLYTGIAQNDQTHGLMFHTTGKIWEFGAHAFVGNMFQRKDLRHRGGSIKVEKNVSRFSKVGTSVLISRNNYRLRGLAAIHAKAGLGSVSSLLAESGIIRTLPTGANQTTGHYVLLQTVSEMTRGLNFLSSVEYYTSAVLSKASRLLRISPGLQYFPMQRLELRLDFQASRTIGQDVVNDDVFNLLGQVHIWL